MEEGMKLLFLLTGTAIVTYWFYLRLLNPFIDAALAIIKCGLGVVLKFFFHWVYTFLFVLQKPFIKLIRFCKKLYYSIHIPDLVQACLYLSLGIGIFIFDHFYATKIYDADQTTFYKIPFQEQTYWVTQQGMTIGGFFVGLAALLFILEIFRGINWLLDRKFQIAVIIQR